MLISADVAQFLPLSFKRLLTATLKPGLTYTAACVHTSNRFQRWCGQGFLGHRRGISAVNLSQQSLHSIQFDAGSGPARNPMQSTASGLMGSSAVSLVDGASALAHAHALEGSLNHEA